MSRPPDLLAAGDELPRYSVKAFNEAAESENKIHDDSVARLYGFKGSLVPGVTDYAYMTRPIVEALGSRWLEHGRMSARFLQPIYEGDEVTITAKVIEAAAGQLVFEVAALNPAGELCATGTATLDATAPEPPSAGDIPIAPRPESRPPADEQSLAIGTVLGTLEETLSRADHDDYLSAIADDLPLYRGEDGVAHSGWLIRFANSALSHNVRMGPWIHVSSEVTHYSLARHGDHISTRSIVTGLFERKGHKFVDLDVLIIANERRPVMRVAHRAIYEVRKVSEAAP